jgi:hypothetical protein
MLIYVTLSDGTELYFTHEDYKEFQTAMDYLGVKYEAHIFLEKMYCFNYFDYIDDEWKCLWSTEEEYDDLLEDIINAEVDYYIEEYN